MAKCGCYFIDVATFYICPIHSRVPTIKKDWFEPHIMPLFRFNIIDEIEDNIAYVIDRNTLLFVDRRDTTETLIFKTKEERDKKAREIEADNILWRYLQWLKRVEENE